MASCTEDYPKKSYFKNGNIKRIEFYSNEEKDSTYIFYDLSDKIIRTKFHIHSDSVYQKTYYKNGSLFKKGWLLNIGNGTKFPIGKWYYYNKNEELSDIRQYMIVRGESILNQIWFLNEKGDTVVIGDEKFNSYEQKTFVSQKIKNLESDYLFLKYLKNDTLKVGEAFTLLLMNMGASEKSFSKVFIEGRKELKEDFSNEFSLELHEYNNLSVDTINQKWFKTLSPFYDDVVLFGVIPPEIGKNTLKGYMLELINDTLANGKIKERIKNKTYFKIPLYVKDTI